MAGVDDKRGDTARLRNLDAPRSRSLLGASPRATLLEHLAIDKSTDVLRRSTRTDACLPRCTAHWNPARVCTGPTALERVHFINICSRVSLRILHARNRIHLESTAEISRVSRRSVSRTRFTRFRRAHIPSASVLRRSTIFDETGLVSRVGSCDLASVERHRDLTVATRFTRRSTRRSVPAYISPFLRARPRGRRTIR
ncbi:hypothetical protein EXIGLDRAFT_192597 [Exidia glandulosa HHB12029]|uniref:Uncharacterized protein n=1 Tax=Exidia glandulosa HHB12029 TaxID=1314781 RepID=A0A165EX64_EXIGL|nr:hypothetical protein EXIGLDRAFT_192597 [Exidia glandulosa HHB12029]